MFRVILFEKISGDGFVDLFGYRIFCESFFILFYLGKKFLNKSREKKTKTEMKEYIQRNLNILKDFQIVSRHYISMKKLKFRTMMIKFFFFLKKLPFVAGDIFLKTNSTPFLVNILKKSHC